MKKVISMLVLSSVLSLTLMQAQVQANVVQNIVETHKVASINSDDMNMLFDSAKSGDVIALSDTEMSETKGEGILAGLLAAFLTPIAVKAGEWVANKLFG